MGAQIVWLEGVVDPGEVGQRAAALARLRSGGVPCPRAFVLGKSLLEWFAARLQRGDARAPVKIPTELHRQIAEALRNLAGSAAIRRSPLEGAPPDDEWLVVTQGGRPERETYLHLTDAAEVSEAVRRIWGQGVFASPPAFPVAIIVQRFMAPEVCAVVRRDRSDPDVLHVSSSLGVGDLLSAGLVVPDRHTIRRDGHVLASSLGRKAQMTVPRPDGGVMRVPVPASAARRVAIDEVKLAELAATWRAAAVALERLTAISASWSGGRWYATSAASARPAEDENLMLG